MEDIALVGLLFLVLIAVPLTIASIVVLVRLSDYLRLKKKALERE